MNQVEFLGLAHAFETMCRWWKGERERGRSRRRKERRDERGEEERREERGEETSSEWEDKEGGRWARRKVGKATGYIPGVF